MKFAIQINSSPYQSEGSDTAYHFVLAALQKGHEIFRVFFYFDGIYNALGHAMPPSDEKQIIKRWSELAREHDLDLVVCVSAAKRRGLLTAEDIEQVGHIDSTLAKGFRISGLGQLVEAAIKADRLLVFGG